MVAGLYGVSKFFDSFWGGNLVRALINVSVEVRRGEILGLLGPSGSGKSTAIKILAGRLRVMEGKAEVFGRSPRSGAVRARVGYLPEGERRSTGAPAKGLRAAFDQLVGADEDTGSRVAGAGLRQALLGNPDLLLLDDPFGGLEDVSGLREMKQRIRSLARNGRTVVLTSRSLAEVNQLCDRAAVFRGGSIEAVGTIEELLATDGALQLLAPVLPLAMAERLVAVIRENIAREEISAGPMPRAPVSGAAEPEVLRGGGSADQALALPKPPPDSINHERLAKLAKPAARVAGGQDATSVTDG